MIKYIKGLSSTFFNDKHFYLKFLFFKCRVMFVMRKVYDAML